MMKALNKEQKHLAIKRQHMETLSDIWAAGSLYCSLRFEMIHSFIIYFKYQTENIYDLNRVLL